MSMLDGISNSAARTITGGSWSVSASPPASPGAGDGAPDDAAHAAGTANSSFQTVFLRTLEQMGTSLQPTAVALDEVVASGAQRIRQLERRVDVSTARLGQVSGSLRDRYDGAAMLPSASTGEIDPSTFVPANAEEAAAFAERMAVDVIEAAARLQLVDDELGLARARRAAKVEGADEQVRELVVVQARQRAYVDELARVIDELSGGTVLEAGRAAIAAGGLPGWADSLGFARVLGGDADSATRIAGALDLAKEEARTGHSLRLDQAVMGMRMWLFADRAQSSRDRARGRAEAQDAVDRRAATRRDKARLDAQQDARRDQVREAQEVAAAARAETHRALMRAGTRGMR